MRQRTIPAPGSAAAADFSQPDTCEGGRDAVARFGNQVRAVYEALSYRKTAHYRAARQGRLVTADNLIRAATYFGPNPVDLQVRYGLISPDAVTAYVESAPHPV